MTKTQDDVAEQQQQSSTSYAIITKENTEKFPENNVAGTTQLIERSMKQIQIKEETTTKKILRTREIKHHTEQPPEQISSQTLSQSAQDNENFAQNPANIASKSLYNGNNYDMSDYIQTNGDVHQQYMPNNVVQDEIPNQSNPTQDNFIVNDTTNNYQNLTAGLIVKLDQPGLSAPSDNYGQAQPINRATSRNSNVVLSGYEELDNTFAYVSQQQPDDGLDPNLVDSAYGYVKKNSQKGQAIASQLPYTQNNVSYIAQPSTYDSVYGTSGMMVQMPTSTIQPIYAPASIEPIYAMRPMNSQQSLPNANNSGLTDVMWRNPEIAEVIAFMQSPDPVVRANSVAYLQHLSYMDDNIKKQTRLLGGIPILINLLNLDVIEVKRNVCGALRNLSYGRKNDENKRAIRDSMGIQTIVHALVNNPDNEIRELGTSVLWNLSSCEEIKWSIIDDALNAVVSVIIVPYTSWFQVNINEDHQFLPAASETHWSTVLRNATGMIRNISSAGAHARKQLRECDGLIESIFFIVRASIERNDVENKLIENCVCLLRNLSYRCQETQDPDYDKHFLNNSQTNSTSSMHNSQSSPTSSTNLTSSIVNSSHLGCFRFSRKSKSKSSMKNSTNTSNNSTASEPKSLLPPHHPSHSNNNTLMRTSTQINMSNATLPRSNISEIPKAPFGKELLWQTDVVKHYLALLKGCSNYETLEAAAGAIQNLAACFWQPSIEIRAAVRKEKGLPVLAELLKIDADRVVCVVATALRNLAIDQRSKELIGIYAMPDLVSKLPGGSTESETASSDDTIAAVLATLHEVISNNADFSRSLYDAGGLNRLTYIVKNKTRFSVRVQRFTAQVLLDMWKFTELRDMYKKGGWKESHFVVRSPIGSKNSTYSVNSNTIERPIASQHADRSSSVKNLRAISSPKLIANDSTGFANTNAVKMNSMYQPLVSVPMTNLNGHIGAQPNNVAALYAQVDRQRKRNGIVNQ